MADVESLKRSRDEAETVKGEGNAATKKVKVEPEGGNEGGMQTELPPPPAAKDASGGDPPVTIMYKTFTTATDCRNYYSRLLSQLRQNQNLNEYEHNMVLGLLRKGHPEPARKIGPGVSAIQTRALNFSDSNSTAFCLIRTDDSAEDFSVKKCVAKLFPKTGKTAPRPNENQLGRGGRGERAGRGRGRGGDRGRPSGRGGMDMARGRGPRGRGPRGRGPRGRGRGRR